ncbi:MAG: class III cytochrome C family protein [Betaproteobacteria bacterium]|nr:class III cytochrome C family protein [Betaproteobacteria bacterium]
MSRIVKFALFLNLATLTILVFVYPQFMVSPGKLIPGHEQLESDCFACHSPFTGANSSRCVTCHKPADIGILTTAGVPISDALTTTPFHQKLISEDCVACHSDHAGVRRFRIEGRFAHSLLDAKTQQQCRDCHRSPSDQMHNNLTENCSVCHDQNRWKPAAFDHAKLDKTLLAQCHTCHKAPADGLHDEISENCGQCHSQQKWKPATFDHEKYFRLDRDHNVSCSVCHARNDLSRYTCYGCHEHTQEKIRREHIKEGIRDYSNCVECHRSASKHDLRDQERKKERKKEKKDRRRRKDD